MKTISLICLALLSTQFSYSQCIADSTANVIAFTYDGKVYEVVKENKTWVDAAACALERGGILVEIDDQAEQDTIWSSLGTAGITNSNTVAPDGGNASYMWIGGNDLGTEGEWLWDGDNTGSSVQFWQGTSAGAPVGGLYNNWGNEPDDFQGQDALGLGLTLWPLGTAGQWNDVDETNSLYYIIEHPVSSNELEDLNSQSNFKIFPNPATEFITFELPEIFLSTEDAKFVIYDESGKLISEIPVNSSSTIFDTKDLANGVYILHYNDMIVDEFVIQH